MATATVLADRHFVSLILHHLSDMRYKDRRQRGPDEPVEFLEFRPTLVFSILVNKLWADEGTSILWRRYPHLPALGSMQKDRQQWYANKVECAFVLSPPLDSTEDLAFLEELNWPCLKTLELEVDWQRHGESLRHMLHAGLKHIDISGAQSGDSRYIGEIVFPALLASCGNLLSIHIGSDFINPDDSLDSEVLGNLLASGPSIKNVQVMNAGLLSNDRLFQCLSKRSDLEALTIDLEPGLSLLPVFSEGPNLFSSLRRLHIMCYPEIALALPVHISTIADLSVDIARIPDAQYQASDVKILDDLLSNLTMCKHLQVLKINVGLLATDFPTAHALPTLQGTTLAAFAKACTRLRGLNLLASEPAAIDASKISSADFEEFCKASPELTSLSLKLHPGTTVGLEESALQSLGQNCQHLEVLRLKVAVQLPSLSTLNALPPPPARLNASPDATQSENELTSRKSQSNACSGNYIDIKAFATHAPASTDPLFPKLTHLAFARPQSVLSISADTYTTSSLFQASSDVDPTLEKDLVRCWAHCLLIHFPKLDILESWGDWTGQDNASLNYFLPLEEPLASTWEFLSGVEQDLWDEGEEGDIEESNGEFEQHIRYDSRGSGDWEKASLINEYPEEDEYGDAGYLHTYAYDAEPENMNTPMEQRQG